MKELIQDKQLQFSYFASTVKPVYKGHSREPENEAFMSSWPLYTGLLYALFNNGKNKTVLYRQ